MLRAAVTFTFISAMAILVIMNADKFAVAGGAIGRVWVDETRALSGSGYVLPK
jgi:hypothetical protein